MVLMGSMLLVSNIIALMLAAPFQQAGYDQSFENPDDPVNPLIYVAFLLVFSALLLFILKKKKGAPLRYFIYFAFGMLLFYVLFIPYIYIFYYAFGIRGAVIGNMALLAAIITSVVVMAIYAMKRVWYVTNGVGVLVAAGAIGLFGVNFSILPTFLFLAALALYDYIAVYKTKHMLTLADGVLALDVPIMLSVPKKGAAKSSKHLRPKISIKESLEKGVERDAMYMGLGDVIIPGVLVVSALSFLPYHISMGLWGARIVALGTLAGILASYVALSFLVMKGKPQAGLPFLNTGAIAGYIVSYIIVYQNVTLGMVFSW